jgi:hypothetical protein
VLRPPLPCTGALLRARACVCVCVSTLGCAQGSWRVRVILWKSACDHSRCRTNDLRCARLPPSLRPLPPPADCRAREQQPLCCNCIPGVVCPEPVLASHHSFIAPTRRSGGSAIANGSRHVSNRFASLCALRPSLSVTIVQVTYTPGGTCCQHLRVFFCLFLSFSDRNLLVCQDKLRSGLQGED